MADNMGCVKSKPTEEAGPDEDIAWASKFLADRVMAPDSVTHGAIVGLKRARLLAARPESFQPTPPVLKSLVKCLRDGDTSDLAEAGVIDFGGDLPKYTPGKVDPGEAIYGTAGQEGGCVIFKTKTVLLIGVYKGQPTAAVRFCEEMADYLEEEADR